MATILLIDQITRTPARVNSGTMFKRIRAYVQPSGLDLQKLIAKKLDKSLTGVDEKTLRLRLERILEESPIFKGSCILKYRINEGVVVFSAQISGEDVYGARILVKNSKKYRVPGEDSGLPSSLRFAYRV